MVRLHSIGGGALACLLLACCAQCKHGKVVHTSRPDKGLGALFERMHGGGGGGTSASAASASASSSGGGNVDVFTGIDTDMFDDIFDRLRPWWKGEHVCVREEERQLSPDESSDTASLSGMVMTSRCHDFGNVHTCETKVTRSGETVLKTVTYECCHGWTRHYQSGATGCPKEEALDDLVATLDKMNLTAFAQLVRSSGRANRLETQGNYTLFVPTNAALAAAADPAGIAAVMSDGDAERFASNLVAAHVARDWHPSYTWDDDQMLDTEFDGVVKIRINEYAYPVPFATANCAPVVSADHRASNGLVNVIDRVMTVPANRNLWTLLAQDPRFSVFVSLFDMSRDSELIDALSEHRGHLTVLAFTDPAFGALPAAMQQAIRDGSDCYDDLVREHVLPEVICSSAVRGAGHTSTVTGGRMGVDRVRDETGAEAATFNGARVLVADTMASNGVLHVVDKPIVLERMVSMSESLADEQAAFDALASPFALKRQLDSAPATLFLPPDDAMNFPDMSPDAMEEMLQNHAVSGDIVRMDASADGRQVTSMAGQTHVIKLQLSPALEFLRRVSDNPDLTRIFATEAHFTVGCARVLRANRATCKGVMHYVDRPLLVPHGDAMRTLRSAGGGEYGDFVRLVEAAGMEGQLAAADFDGTVLALTNDTMRRAFDDDQMEALLASPARASSLARRHVLPGRHCCDELGRMNVAPTMDGDTALLRTGGRPGRTMFGPMRLGGARVRRCDVPATNGLVHTVDRPFVRPPRRSGIGGGPRSPMMPAQSGVDSLMRHVLGHMGGPGKHSVSWSRGSDHHWQWSREQ